MNNIDTGAKDTCFLVCDNKKSYLLIRPKLNYISRVETSRKVGSRTISPAFVAAKRKFT